MNEAIINILHLHFSGEALSEQQEESLLHWRKASSHNEEVLELLQDSHFLQRSLQSWEGFAGSEEATWRQLSEQLFNKSAANAPVTGRRRFLRKWGWAAASIVLALMVGAYLWTGNKKNSTSTAASAKADKPKDILPGKDGAILTLADGMQVVLDSLGNGVVALQNGAQAVIRNGELTYDLTGETTGETVYNTMTTPKGRQFSLLLPDGTRVWLNAASSIRYPTVFSGTERQVFLTGEAYFEVVKNTEMPFLVNANDKVKVEVLGTHFNVNAYENEAAVNTTLLEGSVKVNGTTIKPGQQARIATPPPNRPSSASIVKVINDPDIEKVMAWKNGAFNFNDVSLTEAMRQLERWYDIEVVFSKEVPDDAPFYGEISRSISLEKLLSLLQDTDLKFSIEEGRRLIITR